MKAAVVSSFDRPPSNAEFPVPAPAGRDEEVVDVIAAGLHPPRAVPDQRVALHRRSIPLPEGADPVAIAAALNPAMTSWMALGRRIEAGPGLRILVLGATGNAGRMAVRSATRFGARSVVAAARDTARLSSLGATDTVPLADTERLGAAAALRAADLRIVGSGQGSIAPARLPRRAPGADEGDRHDRAGYARRAVVPGHRGLGGSPRHRCPHRHHPLSRWSRAAPSSVAVTTSVNGEAAMSAARPSAAPAIASAVRPVPATTNTARPRSMLCAASA